MKPPAIEALLICDQVIQDARTGKRSLIGIFDRLASKAFPVHHRGLTLFANLHGGEGEGKLWVELLDSESGQKSAEVKLKQTNKFHPLEGLSIHVVFANVIFAHPGRYLFRLYVDEQVIGEKKLDVEYFTVMPQGQGKPE